MPLAGEPASALPHGGLWNARGSPPSGAAFAAIAESAECRELSLQGSGRGHQPQPCHCPTPSHLPVACSQGQPEVFSATHLRHLLAVLIPGIHLPNAASRSSSSQSFKTSPPQVPAASACACWLVVAEKPAQLGPCSHLGSGAHLPSGAAASFPACPPGFLPSLLLTAGSPGSRVL